MSLKAIKEALDALAEHGAESCQRNDGCWACEERELLERARKEIAVIEKAAKTWGTSAATVEDRKAMIQAFSTIAKEAK